ncbi:MAG: tRNA 4-thiouridine(8) synthase ThiI [Clostridiales bacterium]|nr:tRNA 4-thiouridine(8) synthase ThiI [Clostridiales bacterium]
MQNAILVRYSEIFLKGKNKSYFEKSLLNNIIENTKQFPCNIQKISGRILITNYDKKHEKKLLNNVKNVFGVHSVSPATYFETSIENIEDYISTIRLNNNSFRVTVKRADKNFPINSTEFSKRLGEIILNNNPNIKVDLHNYDIEVNVDIREQNRTFVFYDTINGVGGMPVGTSSGGLLLLSGGIDSPVAGYMMAKRGMSISALHFQSIPYTSEMAKEKVIKLAQLLSEYTGNIKLYICSFTKVQEAIHKHCKPEYMITIMRRIMVRIAERIANENNLKAIITGESLGQVASQTIESITSTNIVSDVVPILRPLIAMDKEEITTISKERNFFETSILPYEDCCTVFLPKYPIIKPKLEKVEKEESRLDIEKLVNEAIATIEIVETKNL